MHCKKLHKPNTASDCKLGFDIAHQAISENGEQFAFSALCSSVSCRIKFFLSEGCFFFFRLGVHLAANV